MFQVRRASRAETAVALRLGRTGQGADGIGRAVDVGEQVQPRPVGPGMARQHVGPAQGDVVGKRGAGFGEDLLEDLGQGEDGRAGIHPCAADLDLPHLAAGPIGLFDDRDLQPMERQPQGGGQTGDAGSHDDNPFFPRSRASGPRMSLILTDSSVNDNDSQSR